MSMFLRNTFSGFSFLLLLFVIVFTVRVNCVEILLTQTMLIDIKNTKLRIEQFDCLTVFTSRA